MRNIDINIDGSSLDVEAIAGIPIKLTYLLQDLSSFDKRGGYFSNQFGIPATKKTNRTFGHYYNPGNIDAAQNFTFKKNAFIESNGINVFKGSIIGESAIRKRGLPQSYKVQLLGQNLTWSSLLEEQLLKDVVHEVVGAIVWNESAVRDSWNNTYVDGFVCPLVNYGEWVNFNPAGGWAVEYWEMRIWLFIRPIIEKMFSLIGYSLQSNFLTGSLFSKLITYLNDVGDVYPMERPFSAPTINFSTSGVISSDRTSLEFFKGIIQMFNLHFYTNENTKEIFCEPFDDFFTTQINWDSKQDISKESPLTSLRGNLPLRFSFNYDDDSVALAMNKFGGVFSSWANGKPFEALMTSDAGEIKDSNNPFFNALTMKEEFIGGIGGLSSAIDIPVIWQGWEPLTPIETFNYSNIVAPPKSQATSPRIAYYHGMKDTRNSFPFLFEGDAPILFYPYAYFSDRYNVVGGGASRQNIDWSDQFVIGGGDHGRRMYGLAHTYYRNNLAIFRRGQQLVSHINIQPSDINNLDMRKTPTLEAVTWILLEITNFNPIEEMTTSCKFIKKLIANSDDINSLRHYDGGRWRILDT